MDDLISLWRNAIAFAAEDMIHSFYSGFDFCKIDYVEMQGKSSAKEKNHVQNSLEV